MDVVYYAIWGIGLVCLAGLAFETLQFRTRLAISKEMAAIAIPFSREVADSKMRILVVGDSTAVGVGSAQPNNSIAGRISTVFPQAEIVNMGISGLRAAGLREELARLQKDKFDLVVIQIGGNDIVRFTPLAQVSSDIDAVLPVVTAMSEHVVLFTSGNVGSAPIFPYPLRWFLTRRTLAVRHIFKEAAVSYGATYIDLYREPAVDPFIQDPTTHFAADKFHPSDAGYGVWWQRIEPVLRQLKF